MGDSHYDADMIYLQAILTTLLATTVKAWGFNRDHHSENGADGIIEITVPQLLTPTKRELLVRILQHIQDSLINAPWVYKWVIGDSSLERGEEPLWSYGVSRFENKDDNDSDDNDDDDDSEYLGQTHWLEKKIDSAGSIFSLRYSIGLEKDYDQHQMEQQYLRDRITIHDVVSQKYFTWESTPQTSDYNAYDPYIFDLFHGGHDVFLTKTVIEFIKKSMKTF